jgi:transcriptional regulator GlxA family with amidase domain
VRAAKDILNERLGDPPTLDELARLIGSNRRQINEAFQACCGQPTFGWLREERLRRAHHLVCTTESPISLIGEHLGYGTPANFTRAFHDRFGFSPRELRRSLWVARQSDEQDATG